MWNFLYLGVCLLFSLLLVFFIKTKDRIKSKENELFETSIYICISSIVIEIILQIMASYKMDNTLSTIFNKLYLIAIVLWFVVFSKYIFYIFKPEAKEDTLEKEQKYLKKYSVVSKMHDIIGVLFSIMIFVLPINHYLEGTKMYSYGPAVGFLRIVLGVFVVSWLVVSIKNIKRIANIKYLSILVAFILLILNIIIQHYEPTILIVSFTFTFLSYILYHTIENPDIQMIETLLRNKELVEKTVNDKSNFLFKVSQEIKKPVKDIMDKVKDYKNIEDIDEKNKLIEQVGQDANNAYFIINDITNISSMDVKKLKIKETEYITEKLFVDIEANVKNRLGVDNKDIKFDFKVNNSYPEKLCGDYIKLRQVLLSVLYNSIKHTKKGFVDFEVDVVTRYDSCRMIFSIKDSGGGMDISKVNELLSSDLKIPVIIKILKRLGGSINIRSEEENGTVFVIVIDQKIVKTKEEMTLKNAKMYQESLKSKKRILIADDNNEMLEKKGRLFSKYNVDTIQTLMGHDVIDKINAGDRYDLIVLKDDMKPESAYSVLKRLKENKKFNTPVIIAIKKDKEFIKEHFIEDGFADCIIEDNIEDEVRRVCNKY